MTFYLGCAVWSYDGWLGTFYPPKTPKKAFLSCYSQRFHTVEGNTTFYAMPSSATVQRWQEETPNTFKFCLKFPQTITHQGALIPNLAETQQFIERVQVLDHKLGCIFAQLPPSYGPNYLEDLQQFLASLLFANIPLAVEVRHLDWWRSPYQEKLHQCLQNLNVAQVILDTRPVYRCSDNPLSHSQRPKPDVPVNFTLTANFVLIRFISHPQLALNNLYLKEWTQKIQDWLNQNITVYCFIHCPIEDHSPQIARYFYQQLQQECIGLDPLPWDKLAAPPQQLSLF